MITISESNMNFGPFEEDCVFYIEKSHLYQNICPTISTLVTILLQLVLYFFFRVRLLPMFKLLFLKVIKISSNDNDFQLTRNFNYDIIFLGCWDVISHLEIIIPRRIHFG